MKGHPFEIIYNHGFRHILKTRPLPPAHAPRRFACGVATVWLIATSWAFHAGAVLAGQILGYSLVVAVAFPTFTGFCIPSLYLRAYFRQADGLPDEISTQTLFYE